MIATTRAQLVEIEKGEPAVNRLLAAAKLHYQSKRDEAIANLEVYFTKAVGIGEHSDLQEEIRKWTDVLSNSRDGLESLDQHFGDDGNAK